MVFVEENSYYRRLTRVWHVLAACAAMSLAYNFMSRSNVDKGNSIFASCCYSNMMFLFSWALNLGMTIWVSFVAGLVMLKNLDRHTFTSIQSRLFPIYFIIQTITSLVQMAVFLMEKHNITAFSANDWTVFSAIAAGLLCGILNGTWLGPVVSTIGFQKRRMEKEEGVMAPNIGSKLGEDRQYRALSRRFGKFHGISTLLNLASLSGSMYILYYISYELIKGSKLL